MKPSLQQGDTMKLSIGLDHYLSLSLPPHCFLSAVGRVKVKLLEAKKNLKMNTKVYLSCHQNFIPCIGLASIYTLLVHYSIDIQYNYTFGRYILSVIINWNFYSDIWKIIYMALKQTYLYVITSQRFQPHLLIYTKAACNSRLKAIGLYMYSIQESADTHS